MAAVRLANAVGGKAGKVDLSRYAPAIAGISGNRVFVWGGRSVENRPTRSLATGEIISLPDGKNSAVRAAPFKEPVDSPRAAAFGDRVLVVGTLCPKWRGDEKLVSGGHCAPGSRLVGAIYDAKSRIWVPVDFEPGVADTLGFPLSVEASDQGLALVSSVGKPDVLVVVDLASAKARRFPAPPLGEPYYPQSPIMQTVVDASACLSGSTVVVVERAAPTRVDKGLRVPGTVHTYVASIDADGWRKLADPPGIGDAVLTCGRDGVLVSGSDGALPSTVGVDKAFLWLNLATEAWQDVERPDFKRLSDVFEHYPGAPAGFGVHTRSGADLLLLQGFPGSAVLRLDAPKSQWTALQPSPMSFDCERNQCVTVTDSYVVGAHRVSDNEVAHTVLFWTAL